MLLKLIKLFIYSLEIVDYMTYLIKTKLPISKIINMIANKLKYLSIKSRIGSPNFHIKALKRKNLADRLNVDARTNEIKFISKAPAEIVITLNGIGVKPAVKTTQKFQTSYFV